MLHWLYKASVPLRSTLRVALGKRLLHISKHPEILRRANICPLLQIVTDIVSGINTACIESTEVLSNLINKVLLPLHEPNYMIEWRDQVAVIQV